MAFDIITPVNMGRGNIATSPSTTTFFTVVALTRGILKCIDIANTTAAAESVTIYLVPSGDSPSDANTLIPDVTVQSNQMFQWTGAQVLEEGDTIVGSASATGLTFQASGGEAV
jgi:hypothetical protein